MKNYLIVIAVSLLLNACAHNKKPQVQQSIQEIVASPKSHSENLPSASIFALLIAEFALLDERMQEADDIYYTAATQTENLDIIERAFNVANHINSENALPLANLWYEKDDKNPKAANARISREIFAGNTDDALKILQELANKDYFEAQETLNKILDNDFIVKNDVIDFFTQNYKNYLDSLLQAATHIDNQEPLQAIDVLEQIKTQIDKDEHRSARTLLLSNAYYNLEGAKKSLQIIEEGLSQTPNDEMLNLSAMLLALETNDLHKAAIFSQKINLENAEQLDSTIETYMEKSKYKQAIFLLNKVIDAGSTTDKHYLQLTTAYLNTQDLENAENSLSHILDSNVYKNDVSLLNIELLYKQFQDVVAKQNLDDFVKANNELKLFSFATIANKISQTKPYTALSLLDEATKEDKQNQLLLYTRAIVYNSMEDYQNSINTLQKLVKINPENPAVLNFLGYSLTQHTKRYDEAKKYLKNALKLEPNASYIVDSYGYLLYKTGKKKTALKYLLQAYDDFKDIEIVEHIFEVLDSLKREKQLKEFYQQAINDGFDEYDLNELLDKHHIYIPGAI